MKTKIYLFISLFIVIACKTSIDSKGGELQKEEGLLPIVLKIDSDSNQFSIKTINDTILWTPKKFNFIESNCSFMKELFSNDTFVLSFSSKFDNSIVSGNDNARRDLIFFVDVVSEKVLKIKFDDYIKLSVYKSWITNSEDHKAIIDVDFENNVLILLDGSGNELKYDLTEVKESFPINCL